MNGARSNGTSKNGYKRWQKLCSVCSKSVYTKDLKDSSCEACGFEADDRCQLCFVDGKTICQNCNAVRLKQKKTKEITTDSTFNIWDRRL